MTSEGMSDGIDDALRRLADGPIEDDFVEDLVAARLFTSVQSTPKIDRFTLLELIGSGGMGTVYAAYDPKLDRRVAIKVVRTGVGAEPSDAARARLIREARVLAQLNHPNVVTIHETGLHGDHVFVVMEFIEGRSIDAWAEAEPRSWSEVLAMYVQAGEGLVAAHALGLVHRDFKPGNVLVGPEGRPRVVDFGLARPIEASARLESRALLLGHASQGDAIEYSVTATGKVCGTAGYLAPELSSGGKPSPQSDQFSFCVALLEALSPKPGEPATARVAIPEPIVSALLRGVASDPALRWPSLDVLLSSLREVTRQPAPGPAFDRGRAWLGVAALALVLIMLVALDRLGGVALFTAKRMPILDLAMLVATVLVLVLRRARPGSFALALLTCMIGQLLNDVLGVAIGRPLEQTLLASLVGSALVYGLAASLRERWLGLCALAQLGAATLVVLAPDSLGLWALLATSSAVALAATFVPTLE